MLNLKIHSTFRGRLNTWPSSAASSEKNIEEEELSNFLQEFGDFNSHELLNEISSHQNKCGLISKKKFKIKQSKPSKKSLMERACGYHCYKDLIAAAIKSSPEKKLTLKQIYLWIEENVPHFRSLKGTEASKSWNNSVRHNLSIHKEFVKTAQSGERSCLWSYEEQKINKKAKKCMSIFRRRVYTAPGSFESSCSFQESISKSYSTEYLPKPLASEDLRPNFSSCANQVETINNYIPYAQDEMCLHSIQATPLSKSPFTNKDVIKVNKKEILLINPPPYESLYPYIDMPLELDYQAIVNHEREIYLNNLMVL